MLGRSLKDHSILDLSGSQNLTGLFINRKNKPTNTRQPDNWTTRSRQLDNAQQTTGQPLQPTTRQRASDNQTTASADNLTTGQRAADNRTTPPTVNSKLATPYCIGHPASNIRQICENLCARQGSVRICGKLPRPRLQRQKKCHPHIKDNTFQNNRTIADSYLPGSKFEKSQVFS